MAARKKTVPEEVPQEVIIDKPVTAVTYTKEQIVESARYRNRRDLVNAVLVSGKKYSIEQVEQAIELFMKGRVK